MNIWTTEKHRLHKSTHAPLLLLAKVRLMDPWWCHQGMIKSFESSVQTGSTPDLQLFAGHNPHIRSILHL